MKKYLLIFVICIIITEESCCEVNLSQQQLYSKYSAQWTEYATIVDSFMLVYDFPTLNKMSRDFVKYINLARINPQLFAQTYLANYSCPTNYSNKKFDSCKQSLTQYLTKLSPRKNLIRISWDRSIACYETIDSFNLQSELDLSANPYYTKEDYLNRDFLGKDFNGSVTVDTVNNCDCSPKTGFDLAMYVLLGLDAIAENDINNFTERKKWLIDTVIVGTDTLTMFNVGIAYYHPDFVVSNFDRQVYMMYSLSTNMTKDDYILAVLNKVIGMWEPAEDLKYQLLTNQLSDVYKEYLYNHLVTSVHAAMVRNKIVELNKYDSVDCISEEMVSVMKDGKWGYTDEYGNIIIKCSYKNVSKFVDGKATVMDSQGNIFCIDKNDKTIECELTTDEENEEKFEEIEIEFEEFDWGIIQKI